MDWKAAQIEERKYHYLSREEGIKHYAKSYENYFHYLGIDKNLKNKLIAEIGPADFPALAFCENIGYSYIVEPLPSVILKTFGIGIVQKKAEELTFGQCDEVWLFNVLQHVEDPGKIVENAKLARCVRFFEPINYGVDACHLHNLTLEMFQDWFGEVNYYPKNEKAIAFHQWECAYGVWLNDKKS
jgi:hypothetical protein